MKSEGTPKQASALDGLDPEQRVAAGMKPGPLLINAGAGTGKTRTLIHRIAYMVQSNQWQPENILAVTHSSKAAGEMRERLIAMNIEGLDKVTAKTFHATALGMLKHFWGKTERKHALTIAQSPYPHVRKVLEIMDKKDPETTQVFDIAAEIGWAKSRLITPKAYPKEAQLHHREVDGYDANQVAKAYSGYQSLLLRLGLVDFTDLLTMTAELIEQHEDVATEVRARYKHFLVDEYQDTDPAQERFLHALLGERLDITAVGDARQAIYRFKGAEPGFLNDFSKTYKGAKTVNLVRDYRSTTQIVHAANTLMSTPKEEALIGMRGDGERVKVTPLENEGSEALFVSNLVEQHHAKGTGYKKIAILYRFNAQSAAFEAALTAKGIPYTIADNDKFFDRPEIAQVLEEAKRHARVVWQDIMDQNPVGDDEELKALLRLDMDQALDGLTCIGRALQQLGFHPDEPPQGAGATRERWEARKALLDMVKDMPQGGRQSARVVLGELERRKQESHGGTLNAVTLATIHKAKGLEWETVILPRWVESSIPSAYATSPEEQEEEARLAYVALTRGEKEVHITWAKKRGEEGKWTSKPSRYIEQMGLWNGQESKTPSAPRRSSGNYEGTPKPTSGGGKAILVKGTCPKCGKGLPSAAYLEAGGCQTHMPSDTWALYLKLLNWRDAEAKKSGMPVFSTLSDDQLMLLAAKRPDTQGHISMTGAIGAKKAKKYAEELLKILH